MRKGFLAALAVAVLVGGSVAFAKTASIDITKTGFSAHDVAVQSGDAVSWTNTDATEHEVAVDKTNCKLSLMPSQTGSCTFATPGTFTFNDPTMKGSDQKGSPFAGTLSVAQNTRAVSIAASKSLMIFGDAITLSGTIASKQAGESVTITAQPKGEPTWSTQVTTTADGAWSLQVPAADPHDVPGEARQRRQRTDHGERPAADHAAEGRPQQLPRGRPRAALDGGQDRGRRTLDGLRLDDDRPGAAPEHRAHEHGGGRPRHVVREPRDEAARLHDGGAGRSPTTRTVTATSSSSNRASRGPRREGASRSAFRLWLPRT